MTISELTRIAKHFNNIKKANINAEFEFDYHWEGNEKISTFSPEYNDITTLPQVATICEITNFPIPASHIGVNSEFLRDLTQVVKFNFKELCKEFQSYVNSGVKYAPYEVINSQKELLVFYIVEAPQETQVGDRTYRTLKGVCKLKDDSYNTQRNVVFCVSDLHPVYNYLDAGHTIAFLKSRDVEDSEILVFNQLSLDTSYILAAFATKPDTVKQHVTNNIFVNSRDARITTLKIEKALPEKFQTKYKALKLAILQDFEKNAQSMIVSKFQRQEIKEVTLNNIKFSDNKATYEGISLEASGLAGVVLTNLDTNSEFDIYTIINIYVAYILSDIDRTPKGDTGFATAKSFEFKINDIPMKIEISTTHTRRRVNGYLINTAEVERVVRRAACYQEAATYNTFVRHVSKMSLECHDVLSNGLPVKVHIFNNNDYYKPATNAHPKLKFVKDQGTIKLYINKEKTASVPIKKFVGFIRSIQDLNKSINGNTYFVEAIPAQVGPPAVAAVPHTWRIKDAEYCQRKLKLLINTFLTEEGNTQLTEEQQNALIADLLVERTEAERKSLELLESVVKSTGAVETTYNGMNGFLIEGTLRKYFVEKSTNKVFNANEGAGSYICIVDGRGDMGVGYDALVARLLALKNDQFTVRNITTLK